MASGVPVVAPTGGSFAAAIRAARIGDPDRVIHARDTASRFRWHEATRRYFRLYDAFSTG